MPRTNRLDRFAFGFLQNSDFLFLAKPTLLHFVLPFFFAQNSTFATSSFSLCLTNRPYLSEADHLLRFHIPNLQTQATNDFGGIERGSLWRLQLHYIIEDLRQPIEWDSGIQMVNVMVTNITSKPAHDSTGFHKTGGFQRGFLVRPSISSVERNPREVVLGIEQVGSNSARDEVRDQ